MDSDRIGGTGLAKLAHRYMASSPPPSSVAVSGSTGRSPLVSAAPHRSIVVLGPVCALFCPPGWFTFLFFLRVVVLAVAFTMVEGGGDQGRGATWHKRPVPFTS